jgi:hypothetical protein
MQGKLAKNAAKTNAQPAAKTKAKSVARTAAKENKFFAPELPPS